MEKRENTIWKTFQSGPVAPPKNGIKEDRQVGLQWDNIQKGKKKPLTEFYNFFFFFLGLAGPVHICPVCRKLYDFSRGYSPHSWGPWNYTTLHSDNNREERSRGAILIMSHGHRGLLSTPGEGYASSSSSFRLEVIRGRGSFIAYSIKGETFSRGLYWMSAEPPHTHTRTSRLNRHFFFFSLLVQHNSAQLVTMTIRPPAYSLFFFSPLQFVCHHLRPSVLLTVCTRPAAAA